MVYGSTYSFISPIDYTGSKNRAMALKWMNLSKSAESLHKIPNLIWTDIAASMLVGTKSVVSAMPDSKMQVQMFRQEITYNYLYAIPGILCWAIWVILLAFLGISTISKRRTSPLSPGHLKELINKLSLGRALVLARDPDEIVHLSNASTKEWLKDVGRMPIEISGPREQLEESRKLSEGENEVGNMVQVTIERRQTA